MSGRKHSGHACCCCECACHAAAVNVRTRYNLGVEKQRHNTMREAAWCILDRAAWAHQHKGRRLLLLQMQDAACNSPSRSWLPQLVLPAHTDDIGQQQQQEAGEALLRPEVL